MEKFSNEHLNTLGADATKFGLNFSDIVEILTKWGPGVLNIVIQALRSGLSLDLIKQILAIFGPIFLQDAVINNKFNTVEPKFGVAPVTGSNIIVGDEVTTFPNSSIISDFINKLFQDLISTLLPDILGKIWPEIVQAILNALNDAITKDPKTQEKIALALSDLSKK